MSEMKRVVVLGAGFGGLEAATGLSAAGGGALEITLVDRSDSFFVGFTKIDVLFGHRSEAEVRSPYAELAADVRFVRETVTAIDVDQRAVNTSGATLPFDYLVVALGAELAPDATPGFVDSGGHEFYSMAGATRLRPVIEAFDAGTVLLAILGVPYKCPPAPYEVACQLHEAFDQRGVRDAITMKVAIPGARPVPNPGVAEALEGLLAERDVELLPGVAITSVDAERRTARAGELELAYDLLVGVPVHRPPAVVASSALAGPGGWARVNPRTLETAVPGVFAVGDVTAIQVGDKAVAKAGAFAERGARTVVAEILHREGLAAERLPFDGSGTCYFEVGGGLVARVDANFLGGDQPRTTFEGPSKELLADKLDFERSRRERWFRRT